MRVFDPDKFAVGGVLGSRKNLPGRPLSVYGRVRNIILDPDDMPIPMLTLSSVDLREASAGNPDTGPVKIQKNVEADVFPAPIWHGHGLWPRPELVYTLPEVEAIMEFLRVRANVQGARNTALEKARRDMLRLVEAARTEMMEIRE